MDEKVLVIESGKLKEYLDLNDATLITDTRKETILNFIIDNHTFIERKFAENDLNYKQAIPYVMVSCGSNILLLKRLGKQNEQRLHNKYSLGVGGHINPTINNENNIILAGLYKELEEEVYLSDISNIRFVGLINDETTDVGKFHLGLFFHIVVNSLQFEILEKDKMEGMWISYNELDQYYSFMESWSQIIIDYLYPVK